MMFMAFLWLLVAMVAVKWLLTPPSGRLPPEQAQRTEVELGRLREEVDRLNGQVERLVEEQSFLLRLLGEGERPRLLEPENDPDA